MTTFRQEYTNGLSFNLGSTLSSGATTLTPPSYTGWPTTGQFALAIEAEILYVTDASTHPWPIARGQEGTAAASHAAGVVARNQLTVGTLEQLVGFYDHGTLVLDGREIDFEGTGVVVTLSGTKLVATFNALTNPMTTEGDLIYQHSGSPTRLPVGGIDSILQSNGTDPFWTTSPTLLGIITAYVFKTSGLTGASAATRYVGGTVSGAPVSGTFSVGDFVVAQDGIVWVCTVAGSPGTWVGLMVNPITTKGDIIAGNASGVPTREPVGTDGYVLTADSTQSLGMKWAPGGAGLQYMVTTDASGNLLFDASGDVLLATITYP